MNLNEQVLQFEDEDLTAFGEAVEDEASTLVEPRIVIDEEGLEERMKIVREQFKSNLAKEAEDYDNAEERHARLLDLGYRNARDWLANKSLLNARLVSINLTPARDDAGLLRQIAKLQLGAWKDTKGKGMVWSVPRRRDERLGQFYNIFYSRPDEFPADAIFQSVVGHKGKSGGIAASAKPAKVKVSKQEIADNLKIAAKTKPMATVETDGLRIGKQGAYKLALVRVAGNGLDICQVIEGEDALTNRLLDKWAAEAAQTVSSDAE